MIRADFIGGKFDGHKEDISDLGTIPDVYHLEEQWDCGCVTTFQYGLVNVLMDADARRPHIMQYEFDCSTHDKCKEDLNK